METQMTEPLNFKQWCELNGRLWPGGEDFARNYGDYEVYLFDLGAIELPGRSRDGDDNN